MLKILFQDWTDFDGAQLAIAKSFGLMPADWSIRDAKWVFWLNNPMGNMLGEMLEMLVAQGVLQKEEGAPRFRYNPSYVPPWNAT